MRSSLCAQACTFLSLPSTSSLSLSYTLALRPFFFFFKLIALPPELYSPFSPFFLIPRSPWA